MFEAPLNRVVTILLKSFITKEPSSYFRFFGTTVHPSLTPVKPIAFEKEFISIATFFESSISKIDLGNFSSVIYSEYAASNIRIELFFLEKSTSSFNCCFVDTAPVGLFGEQK